VSREPPAADAHPAAPISPDEWPDGLVPPGFLRLLAVLHESEALGAGRSLLACLPALRDAGWTPSLWLPGPGPLVDESAGVAELRIVSQRPLAYSARGWRAPPGAVARAARTPAYLRGFERTLLRLRPHVVHVNTLRALPEATLVRRAGIPVVLHVHELPEPGAKRELVLRWAARVADVLVAVSAPVADLLRRHAGTVPLVTVHNGVAPLELTRRVEPGLVGSLGTICRVKGTDVFLRGAARALVGSPDLSFEHAGQSGLDRDVEFARMVERLVESPELAGKVRLLGRRPAAEVLARWEIFVLASRQDAFPLAVLEAMQAGLPIVATAVGGVPEQLTHLETGLLVPPERPDELADAIVRLHRDAPLRRRLGEAAAARARAVFSLERQAVGLHTAYLAALNLRHAPPPVQRATREAL